MHDSRDGQGPEVTIRPAQWLLRALLAEKVTVTVSFVVAIAVLVLAWREGRRSQLPHA
jgi:hypothetical protein